MIGPGGPVPAELHGGTRRDAGEGDAAGVHVAATLVSLCVCQNRGHVKTTSKDFVFI